MKEQCKIGIGWVGGGGGKGWGRGGRGQVMARGVEEGVPALFMTWSFRSKLLFGGSNEELARLY